MMISRRVFGKFFVRVFNAHAFVAKFHRVHYAQPFAADASETVNDFHRASGIFFHKLGCRDTSGVETAAHSRRKRDMQNVVARFHVRFKRFKSDFSVGLTRLGNRPRAKCVKELFHVLNKARRVGAAFHNIELRVRLPDKVEFFQRALRHLQRVRHRNDGYIMFLFISDGHVCARVGAYYVVHYQFSHKRIYKIYHIIFMMSNH